MHSNRKPTSCRTVILSISTILLIAFIALGIRSPSPSQTLADIKSYVSPKARYNATTGLSIVREQATFPTFYEASTNIVGSGNYKGVAFTMMLGADFYNSDADPDDADGYFVGARVLIYQLLHSPKTRTKNNIPVIVFVTEEVKHSKRQRLMADGAMIVELPVFETAEWVSPAQARWPDVNRKLHLARMTEYKKLLFIDCDHLILERLDGVFDDQATETRPIRNNASEFRRDEAPLPTDYMVAAIPEQFNHEHDVPPSYVEWYMNAGFYVIRPDKALFRYYASLMTGTDKSDRYNSGFPEQNMFNYAHRRDGNMPWGRLDWRWTVNCATRRDYDAGVKSYHEKFWDEENYWHEPTLLATWKQTRVEMEDFHLRRDRALARPLQ
ncbi:hypothetical protein MRB53_038246 [Persea americana]|nr:hypothetical protein MRB53_038246 [Persea americana]